MENFEVNLAAPCLYIQAGQQMMEPGSSRKCMAGGQEGDMVKQERFRQDT